VGAAVIRSFRPSAIHPGQLTFGDLDKKAIHRRARRARREIQKERVFLGDLGVLGGEKFLTL
jgi:hypothetical protein